MKHVAGQKVGTYAYRQHRCRCDGCRAVALRGDDIVIESIRDDR